MTERTDKPVRAKILSAVVFTVFVAAGQASSASAQTGQDIGQWLLDVEPYTPPGWTQEMAINQGQIICQQLNPAFTSSGPISRPEIDRLAQANFTNVPDREHAHSIVNAAILTLCPQYGSQIS